MRTPALTALVLLAALPVTATGAPTTPGTPEEIALSAALTDRDTDAIGVLAASGDPDLRWLAGRFAIGAGDYPTAARLLAGPAPRDVWGRVDLAAAQNQHSAALALALPGMDAAMAGTHRDALAQLLIGWALERSAGARNTEPDVENAAQFLNAAIRIGPSVQVRNIAEDALFRLPPEHSDPARARARLAANTTHEPLHAALLRHAAVLASADPRAAAAVLTQLIQSDPTDAAAAGDLLAGLAQTVPDRAVLDGLSLLPVNEASLGRRLAWTLALSQRDPASGLGALDVLMRILEGNPLDATTARALTREVRVARATLTPDPAARRALWLQIAESEGRTPAGDSARAAALSALLEIAGSPFTAASALTTPDGAGNPTLLYLAIPAELGPEARTDALWKLATSFSSGSWCDELATRLITAGADNATAERFDGVCSGPSASADVSLVRAHAQASTELRLQPTAGAVAVTASAATELRVTQHSVDAEALFRGTAGSGANPLDSTLDAFLLEPDKSWSVPLTGLQTVSIAPRAAGSLAAITVRAGDQRGTSLVVVEPLRVQLVGRGDDVVIAVLRGDRPVANASILIDDGGVISKAKTGADGITRMRATSSVRVMATSGAALGFSTMSSVSSHEAAAEAWSVALWDRAVPEAGSLCDVQVFGSAPVGNAPAEGVVLQSQARDGTVLESVPASLDHGVGHARIFVQGGGSLALVRAGAELAHERVPVANAPVHAPVGLTLSTRSPAPGSTLTARIARLDGGVEPLDADVTITTPWSSTHTSYTLGADALDLPLDLGVGLPGEPVTVTVALADGTVLNARGVVAAPGATPALTGLPAVSALGTPVTLKLAQPAGDAVQVHAVRTDGQGEVWSPLDQPLTLPSAGLWTVQAWNGSAGPSVRTRVIDPGAAGVHLEANGVWRGAATLFTTTVEGARSAKIVQPGGAIDLKPVTGASTPWLTSSAGLVIPVPGSDAPMITVAGTLQRGKATPLTIDAPAGSRVWAYLRDGAAGPALTPIEVAPLWVGDAGAAGDPWTADVGWGVPISAGLLAEEERIHEATDVKRMDFGFSPAAEKAEAGMGYGEGMGGLMGRGSGGGKGYAYDTGTGRTTEQVAYRGDAAVIGVVDGKAPGSYPFRVPEWVEGVDLEVVVQTADGRWATRIVAVDVSGGLGARPMDADRTPQPTGDTAELVAIARTLPLDAQLHALEALNAAKVDPARLPAQAAWARRPGTSAELAIARHLTGVGLDVPASGAIPDPHHAQRAVATLLLAGGDDSQRERARVAAERLLSEPDLAPWAVARAALALWLAGQPEEALTAASRDPANPIEAAVRAVISGTADPSFAPGWWAVARSPAATPADRALAIHALSVPRAKARVTTFRGTVAGPVADLPLNVEAPLARWHGETFGRARFTNGSRWSGHSAALTQKGDLQTPALRTVPVWLVVPASPLPSRVQCPAGALTPWVDLPPSLTDSRWVDCTVRVDEPGDQPLVVTWFDPLGHPIAAGTAPLHVTPAADSATTDPMSQAEKLALGTRLARSEGPQRAVGLGLLDALQRTAELPSDLLAAVSTTLLAGAVGGDPVALIRGFQSFREHAPDGVLDLPTAAALAHAYASAPATAGGDPKRALAAVRIVMDARFKEELAAVSGLQSAGLDLTALKLLRELVLRYPETPTVSRARFLAPAMLLTRAEGDGDRLGYTRSSLRHTAAGELAGFLLLHRDGWHGPANPAATAQAAQAASTLSDALATLGDDRRQAALAGPLARAFTGRAGAEDVGWQLSLAAAHAAASAGSPTTALQLLEHIVTPDDVAAQSVSLERGRVLEALGRGKDAREAYQAAGSAGNGEAFQRLAWLDRTDFVLPPLLALTPGMPSTVPANLKPGAEVTVTAIAIQLEAALLNSGGVLDASGIQVTGLRPTASRTLSVGADGDLPIPQLPDGAYLLTVTAAGTTQTSLLVRTDAELTVQGSGPTIAHVSTTRGQPLGGAQVWAFDANGQTFPTRTDATGTAFFVQGVTTVLARDGDRYALGVAAFGPADVRRLKAMGYMDDYGPPSPAAPRMQQNESEYEGLFEQDADQKVRASGL